MKPNAETCLLHGEGLPLVCNAFNWCLAEQQKYLLGDVLYSHILCLQRMA